MNKLLYFLLFVLISGCSETEKFTCITEDSNDGLVIKNNVANLGFYSDMKFCGKQGTKNIYSSDCSTKKSDEYYTLFFDTISYEAELSRKSSAFDMKTYQCKKVS